MDDRLDQERAWKELRARFLLRNLLPTAAGVVVGPYVLGLLVNLGPDEIWRALVYVVPVAVVLNGALQQYVVGGWLCRRALARHVGEPPGARLQRILALPRDFEIWCLAPAYTLGGLVFTGGCALLFDKPAATVPIGALVAFALALLVGIPTTLQFQRDVLPHALDEHARAPGIHPRPGGFAWPRQSWYIPYTFSVLMLLLVVYSGVVVASKLRAGWDGLISELAANGDTHLLQLARASTTATLESMIVPVLVICSVLLGFFLVAGWMIGQREREAARAIEASLAAVVAGTPTAPRWIGTDEMGDVAFAVSAVSTDMKKIFDQLQAMAAGNLSVQLSGESGLLAAFRASQAGLLQLSNEMSVLARGDIANGARLAGDLGVAFTQLSAALGATISQAKTIAQGDLRKDIQVSGELGAAIHQMTKNLRGMVGQTQETGARIGDIVVSLRSSSAQLSTATTEQVSALTETANTMTEMSQTSAASADRCAELIKQGESASAVVENGRASAKEAERAIGAISTALGKVLAVSGVLAEKVKQVDTIIETVGFLADQSSTLAINAGIEASRAGDAGRGFAAVAREMRTLASDSRKATGQIREILQEIRQKTVQVDGSVAAGTSTVDEGVRLVNGLGDAVGQLGVTIHDAVGLMRQVEGSARQHQAGVAQVTQALRSMQVASESIRDGARLLNGLSQQAHELSSQLKVTSQSYQLPARTEGATA